MESISRREMIGSAAAAALFAALPTSLRAQTSAPSQSPAKVPDKVLKVAVIGMGFRGPLLMKDTLANKASVVAICDCDMRALLPYKQQYPDMELYSDYRELLEKRKDLDAVIIATPDHTHASIAIAAMKAGKHVYVEKPLAHDISEVRAMMKVARETGVINQMGNQGHSGDAIRAICEIIAGGTIGDVSEVEAWSSMSVLSSPWFSHLLEKPKDRPEVPREMNWDLWLGPAPERPYHSTYHPKTWRSWYDFGNSLMGDRGTHTLDAPVWALGLGAPESIEARTLGETSECFPVAAIVTYRFPAREGRGPVKLTWYEGLKPPRPAEVLANQILGDSEGGVTFHGHKGMLVCGTYSNSPFLLPLGQKFTRPPRSIPRIKGSHVGNFLESCKTGTPASSNFEVGGPLTEICLLGNVAKRVDHRIEWDSAKMQVTNMPEANAYLALPRRKGWEI